jgi:hypothetical protein
LVLMGRLVPLEQLELVILAQRVLQAQVLLAPLAPLVQELLVLLGLVLMALLELLALKVPPALSASALVLLEPQEPQA